MYLKLSQLVIRHSGRTLLTQTCHKKTSIVFCTKMNSGCRNIRLYSDGFIKTDTDELNLDDFDYKPEKSSNEFAVKPTQVTKAEQKVHSKNFVCLTGALRYEPRIFETKDGTRGASFVLSLISCGYHGTFGSTVYISSFRPSVVESIAHMQEGNKYFVTGYLKTHYQDDTQVRVYAKELTHIK